MLRKYNFFYLNISKINLIKYKIKIKFFEKKIKFQPLRYFIILFKFLIFFSNLYYIIVTKNINVLKFKKNIR